MDEKIFHSGKRNFQDAHGRRVYLERLLVEYSYLGTLEGDPDAINAFHLQRLQQRLPKLVLGDTPWVLLSPATRPDEPLPTFLAVAEFMSDAVLRRYSCSALAVAWYFDDIRRPMSDHINEVLRLVDWNSAARDYDP